MDKKSLKLDLMQKLLLAESDEVLDKVQKLLEKENGFKLTEAQKKELDARKKRHLKGASRSYTWQEVKMRARQALKK